MKMHGLASMVKIMHLNQLYNNQIESLAAIPMSRYPHSFSGPIGVSSKESMILPPVIRTASYPHHGEQIFMNLAQSMNAMTQSPSSGSVTMIE